MLRWHSSVMVSPDAGSVSAFLRSAARSLAINAGMCQCSSVANGACLYTVEKRLRQVPRAMKGTTLLHLPGDTRCHRVQAREYTITFACKKLRTVHDVCHHKPASKLTPPFGGPRFDDRDLVM